MQVHGGHVCVTSYPQYPRRTTDRQKHTHTHTPKAGHSYTHSTVSSIYRHACGTQSWGTALKHSLNMQQATLNKQNWIEKMGVRGAKRADWLVWKGEVTTTWCPQWYGRQTWSQKRKKGTEDEQASLSNSVNRTTLAQRCEKNSSQNIELPSWTFSAAASCFCCTRQTKRKEKVKKRHANHHNPSIFRETRGAQCMAITVTASQLRNDNLQLKFRHKCTNNLENVLPYRKLFFDCIYVY